MSERVSQRVNKCAGVRRVSDLGHTAKILCRVPQILAHGKHINFAMCPNLATRQNMTTSTGRDRRATWRYVCRVPPCGTRYRCKFAVCLTEAHGKM